MSRQNESSYYNDFGRRTSLVSQISVTARRRMYDLFVKVMKPSQNDRVLDIGVTCDVSFKESNFFEQFYPHKERLVCVGTENAAHLETLYPGVRFVQVRSDEELPFSDKEFDLVFSNAVVEHAGGSRNQAAFLREACRVGKRVFITTPNRWFPFEHHTAVPVLHYLPKSIYRRILSRTSLEFWSRESNLNLLTNHEFAALFPADHLVTVKRAGIGFGLLRSNLVAYSCSLEPEQAPADS